MKILALGATGVIGRNLVSRLAGEGHCIYVTTRRERQDTQFVRYLTGNAKNPEFLRGILSERWDVIVDFMIYRTEEFKGRVASLVDATTQYIFTSSARIYADCDSPLHEQAPRLLDVTSDYNFLATDEYALSKARQEDLILATGRPNWTIVRPYITFGPDRLQLGTLEIEDWMYRSVKGRSIVFCGDLLPKQTTLTNGSDAARMIAALVGNFMAHGQIYNIAGNNVITWQEVLSLYADEIEVQLGKRPSIVLQSYEDFCMSSASLYQMQYDRMYHRRFDVRKIGALVDLADEADCRTLLRKFASEQLKFANALSPNWRAEALRDRVSGERAAAGEISSLDQRLRYLYHRYSPVNYR